MNRQHRALIFTLIFIWYGTASGSELIPSAPSRYRSSYRTAQKPAQSKPTITESEITEAKQALTALGYWLDTEAKGLDASLRHALIAFQKIEGRPRTGVLTTEELAAIRQAQTPEPSEATSAHIEVDLTRQVLFVVNDDGLIVRILPISSGSGEWFTEGGRTRQAITPTGRFAVTHQIKGWRKSPLGLLYYPNYIYNGVAIHGNPAVPAQPASHGCIRIPMFAAQAFSEIAKVGTVVLVYDDATAALPK